jgi:hypothetical protein
MINCFVTQNRKLQTSNNANGTSYATLNLRQQGHLTFHFQIGIKKMAPYPTSYTNGSIKFENYVATFQVVKF